MLIAIAHAAEATGQTQGIAALGIDGWSIVFQLINFGILFLLLQRFAFRPVLKVLHDRREKIAEGLRAAAEASKLQRETEKLQHEALLQARREAEQIVRQAQDHSKSIIEDAHAHAVVQGQKMKDAAEQQIERDVAAAQAGLRHEVARLVVHATKQVMGETLSVEQDEQLITRTVDAIL